MTCYKIIISVMILYALLASFAVNKTKSLYSCFITSITLASVSPFILMIVLDNQEVLEETLTTAINTIQRIWLE